MLRAVTAAGKGQLRGYSLAKLRKYAKDYSINVNGVVEKDDLIDRLIAIRVCDACYPSFASVEHNLYRDLMDAYLLVMRQVFY